jgi:ArsR family transcriptional regulator
MSKEQAQSGRDDTFRALADPTRRKILRLLNAGEMSAGDLAAQFAISGPSMSHHFNVLKNADLIRTRRNGQQILYSLNTTVVQDLLAHLLDLFPGKNDQEVL